MSDLLGVLMSLDFLSWVFGLSLIVFVLLPSIHKIGPTELGLVMKRFSFRRLSGDNAVALRGEAGYQAEYLTNGFRFKLWLLYRVDKFPWPQVSSGEIGLVFAQVGQTPPQGAKTGVYKQVFGSFTDLRAFIEHGGQKGMQRSVLPPGTNLPIHPVGFLVITRQKVYGLPISPDLQQLKEEHKLTYDAFGLTAKDLELVRIMPQQSQDMVGIVTTLEGDPLPSGDIAGRIGGFQDVGAMEQKHATDSEIIEVLFGSKNTIHNSYQDFQKFLDSGGKMGLQHDPLLYGAYAVNPMVVRVEQVPMLLVEQGKVAVIKSYVGFPTKDTSGEEFKFGSIVQAGHRGIWSESVRTGKYAINPRCYQPEIVMTEILTLNWAEATSKAHNLDAHLSQITAKSKEGFEFKIDLQVQIHVPDTRAAKVISMVGTIQNLVNEVLQPAVGNHFRDKLQGMAAIDFIEQREKVQKTALDHITEQLKKYEVETRGVYIQDVILPRELVEVLTQREIAHQQMQTFEQQKLAQEKRTELEAAHGTAEMQNSLAQSSVGVQIAENQMKMKKLEAEGQAEYTQKTGAAKGAEIEAIGLARAKGYKAQVEALGQGPTAVINVATALADGKAKFMPDVLVTSGNGSGGVDGLAATLMQYLTNGHEKKTQGSSESEEHPHERVTTASITDSTHTRA